MNAVMVELPSLYVQQIRSAIVHKRSHLDINRRSLPRAMARGMGLRADEHGKHRVVMLFDRSF